MLTQQFVESEWLGGDNNVSTSYNPKRRTDEIVKFLKNEEHIIT